MHGETRRRSGTHRWCDEFAQVPEDTRGHGWRIDERAADRRCVGRPIGRLYRQHVVPRAAGEADGGRRRADGGLLDPSRRDPRVEPAVRPRWCERVRVSHAVDTRRADPVLGVRGIRVRRHRDGPFDRRTTPRHRSRHALGSARCPIRPETPSSVHRSTAHLEWPCDDARARRIDYGALEQRIADGAR
jgi:hypothetical protein